MQISANAPGRLVPTMGGFPAFLPDPLPPVLTWRPSLVRALSDADRAIGRLAAIGGALPNPHLLLRPFIRREAVLSSRIEGTRTTLGELLASEAAGAEEGTGDLHEVARYVRALEHGVERLAVLPLSLRLVCELHVRLMTGVRGGHAQPGEFRRSQNWIGPPGSSPENATYVPPPPGPVLNDALACWETFLHDRSLPPLVQAGLAHYQFEAIHPFLDGNGRVGRLMITLFLIERELLPSPLLYLSAFFEATRRDYYDLLLGVSVRGAWEEWLEYFLNGVARQSEDAIERIERIESLLASWRKALEGAGSKVPLAAIDQLAGNPFWSIAGLAERLGVAYTTARRAIERLEGAGILTPTSGKRDRVWCARQLLAILDEPAFLGG